MKSKSIYLMTILFCILAGSANAQISGARGICVGSTSDLEAYGSGTWTSSNTSVATVAESTGVVSGIAAGTAIITYSVGTQTTTVTIVDPSTPLTLSPPYAGYICMGAPWTVNAPTGGTWSSADDDIATASLIGPDLTSPTENATITGLVEGPVTVYVYCEYPGGCKAQALIKVGLPDIVGETDLCIGEVYDRLTCTSGGLTWTSGNPAIADFLDYPTQSGRLFGITAGTTTVTFTRYSGCIETRTVNISAGSSITGTTSVCVGQTTALSCSPSGGTWSSASPSVATVGASSGIVTGVSAGTATISYFPEEGCPSIVEITVTTSAGEIGGTLTVCEGQTTNLSCSPGGGTWSSSNANATVNSSGEVTGVTAGTATITYSIEGGCISTADVTVNATPTISGPEGVCNGYTMTLTGTPGGGTWSSSNTGIATVNSSGVVTGVSSGTVIITYMLSGGCFDTYVVTSGTSVAEISGLSAVCRYQSITLSSTPSGGTWTSSTPKATVGASTGIVTGVAQGSTTITYTIGGTCKATKLVYVDNVAAINDSWYHDLCVDGDDLNFGTGGGTWSSSNTAVMEVTPTTGVISAVSAGTVTLTLTSPHAGCYDTHAMEVHDMPTVTGDLTLCNNHATTSLSTSSTITQWGPVSGDPAYISYVSGTSSTVKSNSSATGTRTITYQFYNSAGCKVLPVVTVNSCAKASGQEGAGTPKMMSAGYTIVPNPSDGHFFIQNTSASSGNDKIDVRVINIIGQIVFDDNVDFNNGVADLTIKDALPGLYLLHITDKQGETAALRVLVE
jgi:trimeric autotransporter adhesin